MNKYKIKLKRDLIISLEAIIDKTLAKQVTDNSEFNKMYLALLAEISIKLYQKLCEVKKEYSLTLSPAQALAFRVFSLLESDGVTSYTGNKMNQIANEIHQYYA